MKRLKLLIQHAQTNIFLYEETLDTKHLTALQENLTLSLTEAITLSETRKVEPWQPPLKPSPPTNAKSSVAQFPNSTRPPPASSR